MYIFIFLKKKTPFSILLLFVLLSLSLEIILYIFYLTFKLMYFPLYISRVLLWPYATVRKYNTLILTLVSNVISSLTQDLFRKTVLNVSRCFDFALTSVFQWTSLVVFFKYHK